MPGRRAAGCRPTPPASSRPSRRSGPRLEPLGATDRGGACLSSDAGKRPRLSLVPFLALAAGLPLAACSPADPRSCSVLCGADSACPDGLTCATDGYCYAADETPGSCVADRVDSSPVDRDGAVDPIDGPGPGDADPGDDASDPGADASPCDGETAYGINQTLTPIPDEDLAGVRSIIELGDCGVQVMTVQIRVDIQHPFRGDIELFLGAPSNEYLLVLERSIDGGDDLHAVFDPPFTPGQGAGGRWRFDVRDVGKGDLGVLTRWSIGINRPAP